MFGLSTLWVRLIGIGVLLAALAGGLGYVYSKGYDAAETKYQLELANAKIDADAQAEVLQDRIDALAVQGNKDRRNAETRIAKLNSDLRDGSLRLRVDTAITPGPRDPGTEPGTERAQLSGQASEFLLGLAAEGDQAIRERNQCIQAYESLRKPQ